MNTLPDSTFLDFETSGLNPQTDSPVEVCAVKVKQDDSVTVFNSLIEYLPHWPWTDALERGHHTREDLAKGMDYTHAANVLYTLLRDDSVLIAYNVLFDLSFLQQMLVRAVMVGSDWWFKRPELRVIDPLTIARDRHPFPHKLTDMCKLYGVELPTAHLAFDDTMALVELTKRMHQESDITSYINVVGYNQQYGLPKWVPAHFTLKPQGSKTFHHGADGTTRQQTTVGKPLQAPQPAPQGIAGAGIPLQLSGAQIREVRRPSPGLPSPN